MQQENSRGNRFSVFELARDVKFPGKLNWDDTSYVHIPTPE
jgi:hypothetical protein